MAPPHNSPYRLIVEGGDDLHTITNLLIRHAYDWDDRSMVRPYVDSRDGITKLMDSLPVVLKSSYYERIGIVVDANSSLPDRWAQLRALSSRAGLELPTSPHPEGTIVSGFRPGSRLGVWLMPDNTSPGTLESFLSKLVPAGDPCWSYADEAAGEARRRGARCPEKDHLKSQLHTWLAWQEEPRKPIGQAITKRYLDAEAPHARQMITWLRSLFNLESP